VDQGYDDSELLLNKLPVNRSIPGRDPFSFLPDEKLSVAEMPVPCDAQGLK